MQNRRDQVQAHTFVVGRLVSAMLRAEPDSPISPLRRYVVGTICGVLLGALALVGCGIYGFISPGGATSWRKSGVLVVEKETGARYVYVGGQLRPVLNYTSARLILGGEPTIVRVSRTSLSGTPHGLPVGIDSAPDFLPDVSRLDGTQWQVCSALREDTTGADRPFVTLWIGATPAGRSLGTDEGLLVRAPDNHAYLAWNNRRLSVPMPATLSALGYAAEQQHRVGWAWLNALPSGPDLSAADVPGRGQPGPDRGRDVDHRGPVVQSGRRGRGERAVLRDAYRWIVPADGYWGGAAVGGCENTHCLSKRDGEVA